MLPNLPDFRNVATTPDGIARELNDILAMTLFCDFEAPQALSLIHI